MHDSQPAMSFPIHDFHPRPVELRLYLWQLVNDDFGLSETVCQRLSFASGGTDLAAIDSLDAQDIIGMLDEYAPGRLFVFTTSAEEQHPLLRDLPPETTLRELVDRFNEEDSPPLLYTSVEQVSFDRGGIAVMGSYVSQIYTLCRRDGRRLLHHCHDLDLGMDGWVQSRSSSDPVWEYHNYDGSVMKLMERSGSLMSRYDFPVIGNRDLIPQMFDDPAEFRHYYPEIILRVPGQAVDYLSMNPHAWRVLQSYYRDDQALAMEAVRMDPMAYTYLSERLKEDRDYLFFLFQSIPFTPGSLYPYLPESLKRDVGVVMQCFETCPDALRRIAPLDDSDILRRLMKSNVGIASEYLSISTEAVRGDRGLIREMAVHEGWHVLLESTQENYTDLAFVEEIVNMARNAAQARRRDFEEGGDYLTDDGAYLPF